MSKTKRLFIFVLIPLLLLTYSPAEAASVPDSLGMDNYARCFGSVLNTSDLLCVGQFEITYADCNSTTATGCPEELVTDTFLGSLVDTDGTTVLRSVQPYALQSQCCNGYEKGVFSIYLTAAEVTSLSISTASMTSYSLQIAGNPSVLPTVTPDSLNVQGALLTNAALYTAVRNRAIEMEASWGDDLLDNSGGVDTLSLDGETYFTNVIPNLREMSSSLFSSFTVSNDVEEKTFDVTYDTDLQNNLQSGTNTAIWDDAISGLGAELGLSGMVVKTMLSIIICGAVAAFVFFSTQNMMMALITVGVTLPILTLVGIGTLGTVAILTFMAAMGLTWVFFFRSA